MRWLLWEGSSSKARVPGWRLQQPGSGATQVCTVEGRRANCRLRHCSTGSMLHWRVLGGQADSVPSCATQPGHGSGPAWSGACLQPARMALPVDGSGKSPLLRLAGALGECRLTEATYKVGWAAAGLSRPQPDHLAHMGPPLAGCRDFLEESELERLPEGTPSYLTAAVGPPRAAAPRKFCSVCGDLSVYTCTRCGSRYCSRRCHAVHTETRCLKFMA